MTTLDEHSERKAATGCHLGALVTDHRVASVPGLRNLGAVPS